MSSPKPGGNLPQREMLFGHPTGLYTLFFAEMWERFSYYGMRALLVLYMIKGFLKYGDSDAYTVYGAYTALVYMTPFFGGMIADRLIGSRRAVVLGGLLMAGGHLMMMWETQLGFYTALALLIAGNGFFKPNISTIVGTLYPEGSHKRDGGFTIFYMGINLGAAMSPLLCGYIGETYGWHLGFGLATIGMLTGLAVFVAPTLVAQLMIGLSALSAAVGLFLFHPNNNLAIAVNVFTGVSLLSAGVAAVMALGRGGLPAEAGAPPDPKVLRQPLMGIPLALWVYMGTLLAVPFFALFVSGFAIVRADGMALKLIPEEVVAPMEASEYAVVRVTGKVLAESSTPAGMVLLLSGIVAFGYLAMQTFRLDRVQRERMYVVFILTFFSMLFWAFFEQAGSSLNNFTDRNIDRVFEDETITADQVGTTIRIQPTQEQLGYHNGDQLFTMSTLSELRNQREGDEGDEGDAEFEIDWTVAEDNVGMGVARRTDELATSSFQAVNPIFILVFGLVFSVLWTKLGSMNAEPSTPFKFALGLLQLGLGYAVFCYGALQMADDRGMVAMRWLLIGYLLQTTGELCLSPVGLSMVTKLSPRFLVNTVMGTWFLATAFSQFLAAIIAQFTSVTSESGLIPPPIETVRVYGIVFGQIAIMALISAVICFCLVPLLKKWMNEEKTPEPQPSDWQDYNPPGDEQRQA